MRRWRPAGAAVVLALVSAAALGAQEPPEIFMGILDGDAVALESELDAGVDPNLTFEERTPLMFAVWRERTDRTLTPLLVATRYAPGARLPGVVRFLIEHGAEVNARDGEAGRRSCGRSGGPASRRG